MMPLLLAEVGESNLIRHIGGTPEVKRHLEDLGFVVGANVTIISRMRGQRDREREGTPAGHR